MSDFGDLIGDLADCIRADTRTEKLEHSAALSALNSSRALALVTNLANALEMRLGEIERDNAVLGLIVLRLLKLLDEKDHDKIQALGDEVRGILKTDNGSSRGIGPLLSALEIPTRLKTPISLYPRPAGAVKPVAKPPRPPKSSPTIEKSTKP